MWLEDYRCQGVLPEIRRRFNPGRPKHARKHVAQRQKRRRRQTSAGRFVNADAKQLKFDAIENEIEQAVQSQLQTNNCGIGIAFLGIKKLGLPENVTQTVFQRMTSERQILISPVPVRRRS